jgi:hypothetical protein
VDEQSLFPSFCGTEPVCALAPQFPVPVFPGSGTNAGHTGKFVVSSPEEEYHPQTIGLDRDSE